MARLSKKEKYYAKTEKENFFQTLDRTGNIGYNKGV